MTVLFLVKVKSLSTTIDPTACSIFSRHFQRSRSCSQIFLKPLTGDQSPLVQIFLEFFKNLYNSRYFLIKSYRCERQGLSENFVSCANHLAKSNNPTRLELSNYVNFIPYKVIIILFSNLHLINGIACYSPSQIFFYKQFFK